MEKQANQDYTSFKCLIFIISSLFLGVRSSSLLSSLYSAFAYNNALSLPFVVFTFSWILFGFWSSIFYMLISGFYMLSLRKQYVQDFWNANIKETSFGQKIEKTTEYIGSYNIEPYMGTINNLLNIAVKYLNEYIVKIPTVGPYMMNVFQAVYAITNGIISVFEEVPTVVADVNKSNVKPVKPVLENPGQLFQLEQLEQLEQLNKMANVLQLDPPTKEEMEEFHKMAGSMPNDNPFKLPTKEEMEEFNNMANMLGQLDGVIKKAQ